jgi:hypothetical protein
LFFFFFRNVWFNGPAGVDSSPLTAYVLGVSLGLQTSLMLNESQRTGVAALRTAFKETGPNCYDVTGPLLPSGLQVGLAFDAVD